jgi:competence protein ComEC
MGERASISEEAKFSLTNSGLAHVISISGFHMALTAGSAFWLIRAVLALFPGLALTFPIKIWAALAALVVATVYLMISGSDVTAVRSYIMIAIMFAAIALNRPALSLRNLAFSAFIILAVTPESLLDASFQMSFAATAALVAIYESRLHQLGPPRSWPWPLALPARLLIGDVITSLAAGFAVDPIGAYHFHRIATYSVLGNMLAMPAISIIVMPMALLSLVAMPFGMEAQPLIVMSWGIDAMLAVGAMVSNLPGAVIKLPAFDLLPLILMVFGGLWLLIWRTNWRFGGLVPIAAGLAMAPFAPRPDIWIDREGQVIAVRLKDGSLSAPKSRKGEFSLKAWLEGDGDSRGPRDVAKGTGFQCDEQSCLALVRGQIVSHVFHPAALADDCRRAAVLIANLPVTELCLGPKVIIDARDLWEKGAQTVTIRHRSGSASDSRTTSSRDAAEGHSSAGTAVAVPDVSATGSSDRTRCPI